MACEADVALFQSAGGLPVGLAKAGEGTVEMGWTKDELAKARRSATDLAPLTLEQMLAEPLETQMQYHPSIRRRLAAALEQRSLRLRQAAQLELEKLLAIETTDQRFVGRR